MCDSGSLGMFEIDLLRGVVIGITKGHRNNILKVHDYLVVFVGVNNFNLRWFCCHRLFWLVASASDFQGA